MTVQVCESGIVFGDFDEYNVFLSSKRWLKPNYAKQALNQSSSSIKYDGLRFV